MHAPLVFVEKECCSCSVHGVRRSIRIPSVDAAIACCGPTRVLVLDHIIQHARGAREIMDLSYSSAYVRICTYIFLAVSEISNFGDFKVRSGYEAYVLTCYFIYLSQLFTWLFFYLLSTYPSIHPSIYRSIHPSIYCFHPSTLSICPSIYPCTPAQ